VSPVTIKTSPNNIDGAWAGIRFVGEMDFDYDNEELVGDKISYLNVSGYSGTSSLEGVGIKRATLTANAGLTLRDVVSIGTVFDVEDVTSYRSLL
ncbi:hypothetical protein, partial [Alcanivorax sp. HI0083]